MKICEKLFEKMKKTIFDHLKKRHRVVGVEQFLYQNFNWQKTTLDPKFLYL